MLPKRPRNHQLEAESRRAFRNAIPSNWVVRDKTDDYGIDAEVEIFDELNNSTGHIFYVQLKATDKAELKEALKVRLEVDTFNYFFSLPCPVLIVLYVAERNQLFAKWSHAPLKRSPKLDQRTFTFNFDPSDTATSSYLEKCIKEWVYLKKRQISVPLTIDLIFNKYISNKISFFDLNHQKNQIESASPQNLIDFKFGSSNESIGRIECSENKSMLFIGGESATCEIEPIGKYENLIEFVADLYVGIGILLLHLGYESLANDLVSIAFKYSKNFKKNPFRVIDYSHLLFRMKNYSQIIQLFKDIIDEKMLVVIQMTISQFCKHSNFRNPQDYNLILDSYNVINEYLLNSNSPSQDRGHLYYNIGNAHYHGGRLYKAIKYYNKARRLESSYNDKDYFNRELAGILFDSSRFKLSARIYKRAMDLGYKDSFIIGLYADSLLFSGNYTQATRYFKKYIDSIESPYALWVIKYYCLSSIDSEKCGTNDRHTRKALCLAGKLNDDKMPEVADEILGVDLLCYICWLKLAHYYHNCQEYSKAQISFLWAAIINLSDINSWANAFFLSFTPMNSEACTLASFIFEAAYVANKNSFIDILYEIVDARVTAKDNNNRMKEFIKKMKEEIDNRQPSNEIEIRLFNKDFEDTRYKM